MFHKILITALLAGFLPASALAPGDPPAQHIFYQDGGFLYSAGRSYLGVDIRDITSDRVSALKLKEERGVEVTTVDQDSPAGKAGLKEHDVILEYNGAKVESEEQLRRMLRETPPGRTVTLGISRDGSPVTLKVQLGDRNKIETDNWDQANRNRFAVIVPPQLPAIPDINIPMDVQISTYSPSLGIQIEGLNRQLGEFFGVKDGEGLLVKSVEKGSAAERAGLKAGDVITRADNEKVTDRADLRRILRSHNDGGKVTIGIVRDKREQNVTIDLPARKDSSGIEIYLPDMDSLEDMHSMIRDLEPQLRASATLMQAQMARQSAEFQETFRRAQEQWRENLKKLRVTFEKDRFI
jgi:membrane-associated protease RseP (regulator of RpoE activity)